MSVARVVAQIVLFITSLSDGDSKLSVSASVCACVPIFFSYHHFISFVTFHHTTNVFRHFAKLESFSFQVLMILLKSQLGCCSEDRLITTTASSFNPFKWCGSAMFSSSSSVWSSADCPISPFPFLLLLLLFCLVVILLFSFLTPFPFFSLCVRACVCIILQILWFFSSWSTCWCHVISPHTSSGDGSGSFGGGGGVGAAFRCFRWCCVCDCCCA